MRPLLANACKAAKVSFELIHEVVGDRGDCLCIAHSFRTRKLCKPQGREAGVRSPSNGYAKISTGSVVILKKELESSGILGLVPQKTAGLISRAFEP